MGNNVVIDVEANEKLNLLSSSKSKVSGNI